MNRKQQIPTLYTPYTHPIHPYIYTSRNLAYSCQSSLSYYHTVTNTHTDQIYIPHIHTIIHTHTLLTYTTHIHYSHTLLTHTTNTIHTHPIHLRKRCQR
ncbi:hypothetical protein B484DRAFT_457391 [Ochromonadaceae sp. CCMP2298]|nr:hypothetical protein B484DRAFT_457391 [Ochromonadaceae sp. CCMP2298]